MVTIWKPGAGNAAMLASIIKKGLVPLKSWLLRDTYNLFQQNHQLLGRMASWQVRSEKQISTIQDAEFSVSSQWGEDGIIDWLIERANIPKASQTFIEFGVETYREANTRFLLQNRNWRGLIMDGGPAMTTAIKEDGLAWKHEITALQAFITRENINDLISTAGYGGEIGILSIDLDGNDYWVWEVLDVVKPIITICEYNAVFGDLHPISIPYDSKFNRTKAHYSNLYWGASIAALRLLATRKQYRFLGTTSAANDAFFMREDYAAPLVETCLQEIRALPSLVRESRDERGRLNYLSGMERLAVIAAMPVENVQTGEMSVLGDLGELYSKEWFEIIAGMAAQQILLQ